MNHLIIIFQILGVGVCLLLVRKHIRSRNRRLTPMSIEKELLLMMRRVLSQEKSHEGKLQLIRLFFGGQVPPTLEYEPLDSDFTHVSNLRDSSEFDAYIQHLTGCSYVSNAGNQARLGVVVVEYAARVLPIFSMPDGTILVLARADRGDIELNFKNQSIRFAGLNEPIEGCSVVNGSRKGVAA